MVSPDVEGVLRVEIGGVVDINVARIVGGESPAVHPAADVLGASEEAVLGDVVEKVGLGIAQACLVSVGAVVRAGHPSSSAVVWAGLQRRQVRSKEVA